MKITLLLIVLSMALLVPVVQAQAPFTIMDYKNVVAISSEVTDTAVTGWGYRFAFASDTATTVVPYLMLGKSYTEQAMPAKVIAKIRSPLWVIGVTHVVVALDRGGVGDTGSYSQVYPAYPSASWLTCTFYLSQGGASFSRLRLILSLANQYESGTRTVLVDEICIVSPAGDTTMLDDGGSPPSDVAEFRNNGKPDGFVLHQNYPNPFNPSTKIRFSIPQSGAVSMKVYNILGMEIATLIDRWVNAGSYETVFDASQFPTGAYFCRLISNGRVETKKLLLSK
jgi:hypothetical protein